MLQGPVRRSRRELKGREMEGWRYTGPSTQLPAQVHSGAPEAHRVVLWDEVGEDEGTGIVHLAPGCGAEDFALGKTYGLPVIAPLDEAGIFLEGFDWLTGQSVHEVAAPIFDDLRAQRVWPTTSPTTPTAIRSAGAARASWSSVWWTNGSSPWAPSSTSPTNR